MSKTVIDTNIVVALIDEKDVHHKRALQLIHDLENNESMPVLMVSIKSI